MGIVREGFSAVSVLGSVIINNYHSSLTPRPALPSVMPGLDKTRGRFIIYVQ